AGARGRRAAVAPELRRRAPGPPAARHRPAAHGRDVPGHAHQADGPDHRLRGGVLRGLRAPPDARVPDLPGGVNAGRAGTVVDDRPTTTSREAPMKAAIYDEYGSADVLQVREVDDPPVGPDTVLVRARATSVNPVDYKVREGYLRGAFPHHLPIIPGWDVAGVVEAVGPAVRTGL